MNLTGVIIGAASFLIIGILHPVVIQAEYHFGKGVWPLFLVSGLGCILASLLLQTVIPAVLLAVLGCGPSANCMSKRNACRKAGFRPTQNENPEYVLTGNLRTSPGGLRVYINLLLIVQLDQHVSLRDPALHSP